MTRKLKPITTDIIANYETPKVYTYNGQIGFWTMTGAITTALVVTNLIFSIPAIILLSILAHNLK